MTIKQRKKLSSIFLYLSPGALVLTAAIFFFLLKERSMPDRLPDNLFYIFEVNEKKKLPISVGLKQGEHFLIMSQDMKSNGVFIGRKNHLIRLPSEQFRALPGFPVLIKGGLLRDYSRLKLDEPVYVVSRNPQKPYTKGVVARLEPLFAGSTEGPWVTILHLDQPLASPTFVTDQKWQWQGLIVGMKSQKVLAALDLETMNLFFHPPLPSFESKTWGAYLQTLWLWPKDKKMSREMWEDLLNKEPNFLPAKFSLCLSTYEERQLKKAALCLSKMTSLFPQQKHLLQELAQVFEDQEAYGKAIEIRETLKEKGGSDENLFYLGLLYYLQGEYGKTYDIATSLKKKGNFYGRALDSLLKALPEEHFP